MYQLQPGKELRYYQSSLIDDGIRALINNDSVCVQLSTGGGKTVIAGGYCCRFLNRYPEKCIVLTFHEHSLLESMRRTLYHFYGIIASIIDADTNHIRPAQVYVCMAQTLQNRIKLPTYQALLRNTGMLICDEVHRGEHRDIEAYFKVKLPSEIPLSAWVNFTDEQKTELNERTDLVSVFPGLKYIGLTATPKNATPKDPLKNHYQTIVCGIPIEELIEWNKTHPAEGLVQNITYSNTTAINRKSLKVNSRGEFDDTFQGAILKEAKYVKYAFEEYRDRAFGLKTIVFNSSIEHSQEVDKYFREQGLPSRHLDGKNHPKNMTYGKWRAACLQWLKETDGAILHNCGVLGTGFDEPSIMHVMVNKFVNSMPHLIQVEGRGSRPCVEIGKRFFIITDLYGNNKKENHGDWSAAHDWSDIFHNPKKPGNGTAPVRNCPECGYINPASVRVCRGQRRGEFHDPPIIVDMVDCLYRFPEKEVAEERRVELRVITKGVNVGEVIALYESRGIGSGKYGPLREMIKANAVKVRKEIEQITTEQAEELLLIAIGQVKEYCKINATHCTKFFKDMTRNVLYSELARVFGNFEYTPVEWKKKDYVGELVKEMEKMEDL